MREEKKLLDQFKLEELEQRYEMGWRAKSLDYKIDTEYGKIEGEIPLN